MYASSSVVSGDRGVFAPCNCAHINMTEPPSEAHAQERGKDRATHLVTAVAIAILVTPFAIAPYRHARGVRADRIVVQLLLERNGADPPPLLVPLGLLVGAVRYLLRAAEDVRLHLLDKRAVLQRRVRVRAPDTVAVLAHLNVSYA